MNVTYYDWYAMMPHSSTNPHDCNIW